MAFMKSFFATDLPDELLVTCPPTFPKTSHAIDDTLSTFAAYFAKSSKYA